MTGRLPSPARAGRPGANAARLAAVVLAAAALLLGGCVYLRLYELKQQLARFDRYFDLGTADGLTLVCREPLLHPDDLRWIGVKPEKLRRLGQAEHWHVRLVKELPPGVTEAVTYDIEFELSFAAGRLSRFSVPERYFALLPKSFVTGVVRSLGHGRVDRARKGIESAVSAAEVAAARPQLPAIDRLLGRPSEQKIEGRHTLVRYRYAPVTPEPGVQAFEMRLTFDTASGELLKWVGVTPVGRIGFDFTADRPRS